MKKNPFYTIITAIILFAMVACQSSESQKPTSTAPATESTKPDLSYDPELVKKYGADQYGMRQFVMAFLKKGPNRSQDSLARAELQAAHMANINRLAEEGSLILAGPFLDDGELRGIYIFDVKTVEEARALTATDPAIQAGSLEMELHPWYGSAALMAIGEIYPRLTKGE